MPLVLLVHLFDTVMDDGAIGKAFFPQCVVKFCMHLFTKWKQGSLVEPMEPIPQQCGLLTIAANFMILTSIWFLQIFAFWQKWKIPCLLWLKLCILPSDLAVWVKCDWWQILALGYVSCLNLSFNIQKSIQLKIVYNFNWTIGTKFTKRTALSDVYSTFMHYAFWVYCSTMPL